MENLLGEICEGLAGVAELAYRLPGGLWALRAPREAPGPEGHELAKTPYGVARITGGDSYGRDSQHHLEERILEIQLYGPDLQELERAGRLIAERLDQDHEDNPVACVMELSPVQPFLPELEQTESGDETVVLTATWSVKSTSTRAGWTR